MPLPLSPCPRRGRSAAGVGPFKWAELPVSAEFQGTVLWLLMRLDPGTATGRDANGEDLPSVAAVSVERRGRREGRTRDCRI